VFRPSRDERGRRRGGRQASLLVPAWKSEPRGRSSPGAGAHDSVERVGWQRPLIEPADLDPHGRKVGKVPSCERRLDRRWMAHRAAPTGGCACYASAPTWHAPVSAGRRIRPLAAARARPAPMRYLTVRRYPHRSAPRSPRSGTRPERARRDPIRRCDWFAPRVRTAAHRNGVSVRILVMSRSASATVVRCVFALGRSGITDASQTRRPA
jgi:hypothetical protein